MMWWFHYLHLIHPLPVFSYFAVTLHQPLVSDCSLPVKSNVQNVRMTLISINCKSGRSLMSY